MITKSTKLYVQLEPISRDIPSIEAIINSINDGTKVSPNSLHSTILHIGLVERLIRSLRPHTKLSDDELLTALAIYANNTIELTESLQLTMIELEHIGYDYFGNNHSTLVMRFKSSAELVHLHKSTLKLFKDFLNDITDENVEDVMSNDANLKYALTIAPHVTIAKSCTKPIKDIGTIGTVRFSIMPVVYTV